MKQINKHKLRVTHTENKEVVARGMGDGEGLVSAKQLKDMRQDTIYSP